jgi:hypothetical protein
VRVKYWEVIAENLKKAGWSWGCFSAVDREGRTIWIPDAPQYRTSASPHLWHLSSDNWKCWSDWLGLALKFSEQPHIFVLIDKLDFFDATKPSCVSELRQKQAAHLIR